MTDKNNTAAHSWHPRIVSATLMLLIIGGFTASSAWAQQVPVLDPYRVSARPVNEEAVMVAGLAGSVPASARLVIVNMRTAQYVYPALPSTDGSFQVTMEGERNDRMWVTAMDAQGNWLGEAYVVAGTLVIKNPYQPGGYWRVGQGHTHTTNSDGVDSPAALEAAYKAAGYDFVVSTDHRGWPAPAFTALDDGMTPDPPTGNGQDLQWIPGAEIGNHYVHLGSWGTSANLPLNSIPVTQNAVDATRALGGIAVIHHPENTSPGYAWDWHTEIVPIRNVSLVEAFNGQHADEGSVASHLADAIDLADEFQQVWWVGSDDCHNISDPGQFDTYAIVVQADTVNPSQADILAAADTGRLYIRQSAQGPVITSVDQVGDAVTVKLADVASAYDVRWYKRGGELAHFELGVDTTSSYAVNGSEGYIRAEITRRSDGRKAYTQPMFVANARDLTVAASSDALVDNNSSTMWDAGGATGSFVVDTGAVRNLNAIRIEWGGAGTARRFNYLVEVSDTGEFAGEERLAVRQTYSNRQALTLDFFDERSRYLRVTVTGQSAGPAGNARVREVEVFRSTPAYADLYIDNVRGNDANSGRAGAPWRTFDHARELMRPRDTLNFIQNEQPYSGAMRLLSRHSGKHAGATVRYRGYAAVPARVDATGEDYGVTIDGVQWLEWSDFDISLAARADLFVTASDNVIIQRNRLHGSQGRGVLGAGKFTLAYNLIYGNATEGVMLYTDGADGKVYNNVIYGNGGDGFAMQNVGFVSATLRNNIVAGNGGNALWRIANGYITDSHNCVTGPVVGPWLRTAYVYDDPRFTDPASGDFTLQLTSPCIDAGIDLNYAADFAGGPIRDVLSVPNTGSPGAFSLPYVDIGAHEACDTCNSGGGGCH